MGIIFNIQRLSVHDGPGIRTAVFFKGCPLDCVWCHNPESKAAGAELAFYGGRCTCCGGCVGVCPRGCHVVAGETHDIMRADCTLCGKCVSFCPGGALEIIGQEMSAERVIAEALRDRLFYKNSGGGITLTGGEPLCQPEFSLEILRLAKEHGLHTCVETSGFGEVSRLEALLPYTDLFLYDWKESDDALHKQYTGVSHRLIVENLIKLDRAGGKTVLRCPVIPGYNARAEHYRGIAALANRLDNLTEIHLLPYHPLGSGKAAAVGRECSLSTLPALTAAEKEACAETIRGGLRSGLEVLWK
ncbi:MAG: glycyl-radical enzyme activating protein [Oscillospiraceae bacterium]|nr:glycyl-radical enzyme activating protein [Oscillospiraceae bacterium]